MSKHHAEVLDEKHPEELRKKTESARKGCRGDGRIPADDQRSRKRQYNPSIKLAFKLARFLIVDREIFVYEEENKMKMFGKSYYDALFYLGIVFESWSPSTGVTTSCPVRGRDSGGLAPPSCWWRGRSVSIKAGWNSGNQPERRTPATDPGKAHETAYYVLLGAGVIAIFVFALIGERFIDVAVTIAATVLFLFLASEIAYRVYEKRM